MDIFTRKKRSLIMSNIKAKNTKPELLAFRILRQKGIYFQKHYKTYGCPDIAFPRKKVAVFINGEFWHGKDFDNSKDKMSDYWREKIRNNIKRDRKNYSKLRKKGWKVITIWGRVLVRHPDRYLNRIIRALDRR